MIGDGHGHRSFAGPTLHDNMTPPPAHSSEPVFFQNPAGILAGENPSLAMRGFESRHEDFGVQTSLDLLGVRTLQE